MDCSTKLTTETWRLASVDGHQLMETPETSELPGVSVYVYRRQPRPALQRLLLLLLLSASFLLASSPCAELSRAGQR
eukprot:COSAG02_NODE_33749_length_495_cov_0.787879_1_plen_76_part_01